MNSNNKIMKSSNLQTTLYVEPTEEEEEDLYNSLTLQNYGEIFRSDQRTWIVDDVNVYRVIIVKTIEGNLMTKPVNGAVLIFNPRTGQLFMKIVHKSEWEGKKSLAQLAKWKTAEEVAILARSLPVEEQPKQIIATRKGILDPLKATLLDDSANVDIRGCKLTKLFIPFLAFMKIDKINELVMNATEPQLHKFNLYDDLFSSTNNMSPYTAFLRLILILRAFHVNKMKAEMLLKPDERIKTEPHHILPLFTDDQWMNVEFSLRDLIISDYVKKNHIVSALTPVEIRDIILCGEITPASSELHHVPEIEKQLMG